MSVYAAYAFDEGSGSTITDYSGNGRDMTVFGTNSWVTGHGSYSNAFQAGTTTNSDGAYFTPGSAIAALAGDVTIMMWYKHTASSDSNCHVGGLYGSPGFARASIWSYRNLIITASPECTVRDNGGNLYSIGSNGSHSDTGWHHCAFVYHSSGLMEQYLDGSLVSTSTPTTAPIGTNVTYLGVGSVLSQAGTEAVVQDFRVFDSALTSTDVNTWMTTPVHSSSVSGTSNVTLKKITVSGTATAPLVGTAAVTLKKITAAISVAVYDKGVSSAVLKKITVSGTATAPLVGTTAVTLKKISVDVSAIIKDSGTADVTLKKITVNVSAVLIRSGTVDLTLKKISISASGTVYDKAVSAIVMKKPTVIGIGKASVSGTITVSLRKAEASGAGFAPIFGTADITLAKMEAFVSDGHSSGASSLFIFSQL